MKTQTPYQFFLAQAGYNYDPKTETPLQGKQRCAKALARAERLASERGFTFQWLGDTGADSREFDPTNPPRMLWGCICRNGSGESVSSLWAIDFGHDSAPYGEAYARVVQAELAHEVID